MSPGAVLQIVDSVLDAATSGLTDPEARLAAVLSILVRTARRAGALHREAHPEVTRGEAVTCVLDRAEDIAIHGRETRDPG